MKLCTLVDYAVLCDVSYLVFYCGEPVKVDFWFEVRTSCWLKKNLPQKPVIILSPRITPYYCFLVTNHTKAFEKMPLECLYVKSFRQHVLD